MEEHKSVIMHLLSQVRLGMDLTKVNLLLFMGMGGAVKPEFCVNKGYIIQSHICSKSSLNYVTFLAWCV